MVEGNRGSDPCRGRDSPEPRTKPEPGDPDYDSENNKRRAVGLHLLGDPPLALVEQIATKLVHLPLQIEIAGFGICRAGRFAGSVRVCKGAW